MNWIQEATAPVRDIFRRHGREKLADMYLKCFESTWETTLQREEDSVFLITGDIPAMWLRDSSAQVQHYLPHFNVPEVVSVVEGLMRRQFRYICLDPYANAFNPSPSGRHGYADDTSWTEEARPWIWERKYEVDSLCYPVRLAHSWHVLTGRRDFLDNLFLETARTILDTFETEQHHENSPYHFIRTNCPDSDTLVGGKGTEVAFTGMVWSGFRPSDDACRYGYLIPSNFFAASALSWLRQLLQACPGDTGDLQGRCEKLEKEIRSGLERFAAVDHPRFGHVLAYEVDGLGHHLIMDDANVPSLLSLPYLGCMDREDPLYVRTRKMVLSPENPYYYAGSCARGIGSPHTPRDHVWPISLCVQGLTSTDEGEILSILDMLEHMDDGTLQMHEGVHKDDPHIYTRPWFAWANSMFSEFALMAAHVLDRA